VAKSNEKQDKRLKPTPKEVKELHKKGKYKPKWDVVEEDENE
jgi:hypothetical protein